MVSARAVAVNAISLAVAVALRAVLRLRTVAVLAVGPLVRQALLAATMTGLLRLRTLAVAVAAVCVGTLRMLAMAVLAGLVLS